LKYIRQNYQGNEQIEELFSTEKNHQIRISSEKFDRLMEWHSNILKPLCSKKLKFIYETKDMSDKDKTKKFKKLFKLFDKLTDFFEENNNSTFLSGSDTGPCAADLVIYSEISTIVFMYAGPR